MRTVPLPASIVDEVLATWRSLATRDSVAEMRAAAQQEPRLYEGLAFCVDALMLVLESQAKVDPELVWGLLCQSARKMKPATVFPPEDEAAMVYATRAVEQAMRELDTVITELTGSR